MKRILLTQGKYALVADEQLAEMEYKWYFNNGYALRSVKINGKWRNIYMHRVVLEHKLGRKLRPGEQCDHLNGIKTDNRLENLRVATNAQNSMNRGLNKNNTSGEKGVYWHKRAQKWMAYIMYQGRRIHLGLFMTKEAAALAYSQTAKQLFGEFAYKGGE